MERICSEDTVAQAFIAAGAVRVSFDPMFTWSSGRKAPLYVDGRLIYAYPEVRSAVIDAVVRALQEQFPEATAIAGVATGGIPLGAVSADRLKLPFVYVRPQPKAHGRGRQVEGELPPGSRAVVLEDILSTGRSAVQAALALKREGVDVLGVLALYSHRLPEADAALRAVKLRAVALTDFERLAAALKACGRYDDAALKNLTEWHRALVSESPAGR
ncbi:MAG: orotate phosphoribosyltransferase [Hydrogenibacillus sp.]|nr:orotate phosphoribosyltransferase [Hydrogenibacillus sp.]